MLIREDAIRRATFASAALVAALGIRGEALAAEGRIGRSFEVNPFALGQILDRAPLEGRSNVSATEISATEISLPRPDGSLARFRVEESPMVEPDSSAPPSIRTYSLSGIDDPTATGRLSWTGSRLHGLVLSHDGSFFIEPQSLNDDRIHVSSDARDIVGDFRCGVSATEPSGPSTALESAATVPGPPLHVFRLAIAATAEYTAEVTNGETNPATAKELAYQEIVATANVANAIYLRDFGIRLLLLPKNDILSIIYTSPTGDPYTSGESGTLLGENQKNLDDVIGVADYDIGHVFDRCSGGLANVGVVCTNGAKALGLSGGACDGFAVQAHYLIHEAGHQFSALHTFNYLDPGGFDPSTAYEPGSGSTIMSYAGCAPEVCGNQSLQIFPDPYFHAGSIASITDYVRNGPGTCASQGQTSNHRPALTAGLDFTIPKHTPFVLTAGASDPDGDAVRYAWEEYDLGAISPPNTDADGQERPIFRSYLPTADPSRTFPSLRYVLENANDPPEFYSGVDKSGNPRTYLTGESLPMITRTMTFRVTARDGRGGVASDDAEIEVDGNSGPFAVTAPNTATAWTAGETETVTWDVAGTNAPPVSCANIRITFSPAGGLDGFPMVLAGGTPNDGSENVIAPSVSTEEARVRIECVGNVFFDVSDANFAVNPPAICGNGVLEPGESCDDGAANGAPGGCCSAQCAPLPQGSSCNDGDPCTLADTCRGTDVCVSGRPTLLDPLVDLGQTLACVESLLPL